jgi:regulator of RNase E activity RraA
VLADDNGIVVMSPQVAEEIYPAARRAEDRSPLVRQWLRRGGDLAEVSGKDPAEIEAMLREWG